LCYRLRGSEIASTHTPDLDNANVGNNINDFNGIYHMVYPIYNLKEKVYVN
jgi:hypothetical protein